MKRLRLKLLITIIIICFVSACKRFVDIPPPNNQIVSSTVFTDDLTATATITGIYGSMMDAAGRWGSGGMAIFTGLSADELVTQTANLDRQFQENQISPQNGTLNNAFWTPAYNAIYTANLCLEKLAAAKGLSPSVKTSLTGEALFIRAFVYFYLTNLFGEVPLITGTDYTVNARSARVSRTEIYKQILADLLQAKPSLSNTYITAERNRPNLQTANALLARTYLYLQDWVSAEAVASEIINSGLYSMNPTTANVFQKASNETIWQLPPVDPTRNTWLAYLLVPASATSVPSYKLRKEFLNNFEVTDTRANAWIGRRLYQGDSVYYPAKYKLLTTPPVSEHYIVFRLAEIFLIRSEARARQGKFAEACTDLNVVRARAGLANLSASDAATILNWISNERKVELFSEWGDRWFNLKRTGKIVETLQSLKGLSWQNTDTLYPIPAPQLLLNTYLTQNNGY